MSMKLAILWSHPASYLYAAIDAAIDDGARVLLSCFRSGAKAPYALDNSGFHDGNMLLRWNDARSIDGAALAAALDGFAPDVMIISGWNHRWYMRIARAYRGRATRLLAMDNQWEATPRQHLGVLGAPVLIAPYFDYAFVPGERQYQFARRLGFADDRIVEGLFTCDPAFYQADAPDVDVDADAGAPRGFIYVGRLSEEKGVHTLLSAYARYRERAPRPWDLHLYGAGQALDAARLPPGARVHGFVQPAQLPALLRAHQAFVMPSHWEPWGVAIHEAASAGLPLICSACCGAAVHLLKNGFNGYKCRPGDPAALAAALGQVSALDEARRAAMSAHSRMLAAQFHPQLWFRNLAGQLRAGALP